MRWRAIGGIASAEERAKIVDYLEASGGAGK
jgi:hypothetical protein